MFTVLNLTNPILVYFNLFSKLNVCFEMLFPYFFSKDMTKSMSFFTTFDLFQVISLFVRYGTVTVRQMFSVILSLTQTEAAKRLLITFLLPECQRQ